MTCSFCRANSWMRRSIDSRRMARERCISFHKNSSRGSLSPKGAFCTSALTLHMACVPGDPFASKQDAKPRQSFAHTLVFALQLVFTLPVLVSVRRSGSGNRLFATKSRWDLPIQKQEPSRKNRISFMPWLNFCHGKEDKRPEFSLLASLCTSEVPSKYSTSQIHLHSPRCLPTPTPPLTPAQPTHAPGAC